MDQSSRWSSAKDNSIHGKSWILLELENPAVVGELGGLRLFFLGSWFGLVLCCQCCCLFLVELVAKGGRLGLLAPWCYVGIWSFLCGYTTIRSFGRL